MSKDFTATIRKESTRAQAWINILGTDTAPITSPIPTLASAPGVPEGLFYMLDLTQLTQEQRIKLIRYLAQRFDVVESEVAETLDEVGCPILDEDVVVTVHNPLKWI